MKICKSLVTVDNFGERYEKKLRRIYLITGQSCTLDWMINLKFKSRTDSIHFCELPVNLLESDEFFGRFLKFCHF